MKILSKNKKVYFDYELLEKYEAGIKLLGWEVKSIKAKMFSIKDAHVKIYNNCVLISGMHVARWKTQSASMPIDSDRDRVLLLNRQEIEELEVYRRNTGVTIVVALVYLANNKIKLEIAAARGRKKYDKREYLKKKEFQRDMAKNTSNRW